MNDGTINALVGGPIDIRPAADWLQEQASDVPWTDRLGSHLKAGTLSIGMEIMDDYSLSSKALGEMMANAMQDIADTMTHGPKLGPGRNELWEIQRPERVRRNILSNLAYVMPGKRPGRFVRAQ